MSESSNTINFSQFRNEVERISTILNIEELRGFTISTPFSKGYKRIEPPNPDDFINTIIEATIFLIKEQERDSSSSRVNIEDQEGTPLFQLILYPSMIEIKDLRKNDETNKYKIILPPSKEIFT